MGYHLLPRWGGSNGPDDIRVPFAFKLSRNTACPGSPDVSSGMIIPDFDITRIPSSTGRDARAPG